MKWAVLGALVALALLVAGCSDPPAPVYPPGDEATALTTEYDATLEASAAALPLVPADATSLEVTDFDQLRLSLGFGDLDGETKGPARARFWSMVGDSAMLSPGLLRADGDRLRDDFGFTQDDVAWEAHYSGGASDGWVIAFHEELPLGGVRRAIAAGVGPLADAVLDAERHLVTSATPPDGAESWAADAELVALAGQQASSTLIERSCLPFDEVFGPGLEDDLAAAPAAAYGALEPLEAFSVAFGADLVTVRLGPERSDAFDRMRLAEVMPRTEPEFGVGYSRGVADPSSGRLGFDLAKPAVATDLAREGQLPFAVCAAE